MKNFLPLFAFLAIASVSCNRYQYIAISSNDLKQRKKDNREFVAGNDSFQVAYNFGGADMPVSGHWSICCTSFSAITPLPVDWQMIPSEQVLG